MDDATKQARDEAAERFDILRVNPAMLLFTARERASFSFSCGFDAGVAHSAARVEELEQQLAVLSKSYIAKSSLATERQNELHKQDSTISTLREKLVQSEARATAMREALQTLVDSRKKVSASLTPDTMAEIAAEALTNHAGSSLLKELEALRAIERVAREQHEADALSRGVSVHMSNAFIQLDKLREEEGR